MDFRNIPNSTGSNQQKYSHHQQQYNIRTNDKDHLLRYECLLIFALTLTLYLIYTVICPDRAGTMGLIIRDIMVVTFGKTAILFPVLLILLVYLSYIFLVREKCLVGSYRSFLLRKCIGAAIFQISLSSVFSMYSLTYGGRSGLLLTSWLESSLGIVGTLFCLVFLTLTSISILTRFSWLNLLFKRSMPVETMINSAQMLDSKEAPPVNRMRLSPTNEGVQYLTDNDPIGSDESIEDKIERFLFDYGIRATVVSVVNGPTVTCYEILPAPGVKVSQIESITRDIARMLSVANVRVILVPGKNVIGLEVPREVREVVKMRDLLTDNCLQSSEMLLPILLGKDMLGNTSLIDLVALPHLLIAGTTGSGKSMLLNTILLSLLSKLSHEHLKLILIDPKMLELSCFDTVPHLLYPVITDMENAVSVLAWCIDEMEKRYQIMSQHGSRNLDDYNRVNAPYLPRIVVVVDELADLMITGGNDVEQAIVRIAQKARAAGIHLVLATQRPSSNVVTSLIKANIPARISLAVSSYYDSRIVLDQSGAEKLLGKGDLLFLENGSTTPVRIQSPMVDDTDIDQLIFSFNNKMIQPPALTLPAKTMPGANEDKLYQEALGYAYEKGVISTSKIQQRFRIGYNRAAGIMEKMVEEGIVGKKRGNEPRKVIKLRAVD